MSEQAPELSPAGTPILRYEDAEPAEFSIARGDDSNIEAITDHIEKHLGKIKGVFHELVSPLVHLDVHYLEPSQDFPFYILITTGMSDLPMSVPESLQSMQYAELCMLLPSTWPMSALLEPAGDDGPDEASYWPIRWLKTIARFPHEWQTWIGAGHTIPNEEEALPFADNTQLGCLLVLPAMSLPEEFQQLPLSADKTINFYCLYPIYKEEMDVALNKGVEALLDKFDQYGISDVIDLERPNTAKKKGFLGLW